MGRKLKDETFSEGAKGKGMLKAASCLVEMHNGMVWQRIPLRTSSLRTFGSNRPFRFSVPGH